MAKIGLYPSGGHLVKRVIGVAGDTIKCCDEQGPDLVNGVPLDEKDYASKDGSRLLRPDDRPATGPPVRCPRARSS